MRLDVLGCLSLGFHALGYMCSWVGCRRLIWRISVGASPDPEALYILDVHHAFRYGSLAPSSPSPLSLVPSHVFDALRPGT